MQTEKRSSLEPQAVSEGRSTLILKLIFFCVFPHGVPKRETVEVMNSDESFIENDKESIFVRPCQNTT